METLDMATILLEAYQLADKINELPEVEEYLRTKRRLSEDQEAQKLIREFHKVKDQFEKPSGLASFIPIITRPGKGGEVAGEVRKRPAIHSYLLARNNWTGCCMKSQDHRTCRVRKMREGAGQ